MILDPKPTVESKSVQNWFNNNKKFLPTSTDGVKSDSQPDSSGIQNSFKPNMAKTHMNASGSDVAKSRQSDFVSAQNPKPELNNTVSEIVKPVSKAVLDMAKHDLNKSGSNVAKPENKGSPLKTVNDATPGRKVVPKMYVSIFKFNTFL